MVRRGGADVSEILYRLRLPEIKRHCSPVLEPTIFSKELCLNIMLPVVLLPGTFASPRTACSKSSTHPFARNSRTDERVLRECAWPLQFSYTSDNFNGHLTHRPTCVSAPVTVRILILCTGYAYRQIPLCFGPTNKQGRQN